MPGIYGHTTIDHVNGRVSWYGTGIADMRAARRYLRRKFCSWRRPTIVSRPCARFYVSAMFGGRTAYLLGPYVSHMTALDAVRRGSELARARGMSCWASVGTASRPDTVPTWFGR